MLPCLDEAASLPWLLSSMPAGYRPIVADNGSTDGSLDPRQLPLVCDPVRLHAPGVDAVLGPSADGG